MFEIFLALVQVGGTTIAATTMGALISRRCVSFDHAAMRWAVHTALGFLALSYTIFVLALFQLATREYLGVLFALLGLAAVVSLGVQARRLRQRQRSAAGRSRRPLRRVLVESLRRRGWWLALGGVYLVWIVLCARLPALGADELNHHLAVPKVMLAAGGTVPFPDNIYAHFPPLGETLFLFGLGVGGETAARLFHVAFGLILAIAIYGYSRRFLPGSTAWLPAILFFTVPSVMVILPQAYVDVMFTLYAFLAVTMLVEFFERRRLTWVVLSGVMAAGATSMKYTGLLLLLMLVLFLLAEHLFARREGVPVAAFALVGASVPIFLPFLFRNWALTGWPFFPFPLGDLPLRPGINWDTERASMFLRMLASYGSGAVPLGPASLADSLSAPVLVFLRARFDDPRLYDGFVGPVFLLAPLVIWPSIRRPRMRVLALFSLIFVFHWGLTIRQVRFLIPVLPIVSLLLVVGLHDRRSRLLYAVVSVCVLVSAGIGVKQTLDLEPFGFWSGAESRETYLARRFPGYSIYQAANRRLGEDDRLYLVHMRNFGYYLEPEWRGDFVFESYRLEKRLRAPADPDDLTEFFGSREITHLLIDERITFSDDALDPAQRATLQAFLARRATVLERIDERTLYEVDRR